MAPPSLWSGFYLGGNLGGAYEQGDRRLTTETPGALTLVDDNGDGSEFLAGGHLGYNWKHSFWPFVIGVEADLSFAADIDYLASVRARMGFTTERALFYATAGFAVADFGDDDFKVTDGTLATSFRDKSNAESGFVVGGGAEFALGRNWSLGVEGLYYIFDEHKVSGTFSDDANPPNETSFVYENDLDFWAVRGRLTYHFQKRQDTLVAEESQSVK
jgi:outer membrane immunogenic protein